MTKDKTATMSRELAERLDFGKNMKVALEALKELRALLAAPVVERQPEAFMYQHDETGQIGFIDIQQVEWGFEKNNPRLKIICPLYRSPPAPVAVTHTMKSVMSAICAINGFPMLTSNQCHALAQSLNACLDKVKEMNQ